MCDGAAQQLTSGNCRRLGPGSPRIGVEEPTSRAQNSLETDWRGGIVDGRSGMGGKSGKSTLGIIGGFDGIGLGGIS